MWKLLEEKKQGSTWRKSPALYLFTTTRSALKAPAGRDRPGGHSQRVDDDTASSPNVLEFTNKLPSTAEVDHMPLQQGRRDCKEPQKEEKEAEELEQMQEGAMSQGKGAHPERRNRKHHRTFSA